MSNATFTVTLENTAGLVSAVTSYLQSTLKNGGPAQLTLTGPTGSVILSPGKAVISGFGLPYVEILLVSAGTTDYQACTKLDSWAMDQEPGCTQYVGLVASAAIYNAVCSNN